MIPDFEVVITNRAVQIGAAVFFVGLLLAVLT